jgi:hypothetical protein
MIRTMKISAIANAFGHVAVGVLLMAGTAYSQSSAGSVAGTVTDSSGAAVSQASVSIENKSNGLVRTTTTTESGFYNFSAVAPGDYIVTAQSSGFAKAQKQGEVSVAAPLRLDFALGVQSKNVSVQVVGDSGVAIETQNAELGTNVRSIATRTRSSRSRREPCARTPMSAA